MSEEPADAVVVNKPISSLIANSPDSPLIPEARADIEATIKNELLKDVSLDEVRELVQFIRSGGLRRAASPHDLPDEFDEFRLG